MKVNFPQDISLEDLPAVSVGLYHTLLTGTVVSQEPANEVEFTIQERAADAFKVYLSGLRECVLRLTEID